jgi:hypothetical protein
VTAAGRAALLATVLLAVVVLAAAALVALAAARHAGSQLPAGIPAGIPAGKASGSPAGDPVMFAPSFAGPDRLLTNEFAHWNPGNKRAVMSPDWDVTSGSLFICDGAGWTGVPDTRAVDASSSSGTDSSVFRVITKRRDFGDVAVSLQVRDLRLAAPGATAPAEVDGIHLFLRYQTPAWLYVVSLNRRDDQIVIKKKLPGGPTAGGTYVTLGQAPYVVPYGAWQSFTVRITGGQDRPVRISVAVGARRILAVSDRGMGGPAIVSPGAVGLRGDYCEFEFRDFRVTRA